MRIKHRFNQSIRAIAVAAIGALSFGCAELGKGKDAPKNFITGKSNPPASLATPYIAPNPVILLINETTSFSAVGGSTPYTFSIESGSGTINAASGLYTAPSSPGTATVRVTDSDGQSNDATVTIRGLLTLTPSSKTLAVNNTVTFTASYGSSPYTYSVYLGGGTINSLNGFYTAPSSSGSATVRVTDAAGATTDASVTINPALAINPSSKTLAVNTTTTFTATGGVSPYTYSVSSGTGTIDSGSGLYTAPASAGSAIVRVTDSLGATSDANVTVTSSALTINPTSKTLLTNATFTFSANNGTAPYTYSVVSGSGSINSSTGAYTAPASAGTDTVRVTDSLGATSDATVTILASLAINPASKTLAVNNAFTFGASGGTAPYTYSVLSGSGTINSSTGTYTAPATPGTDTVRVTDSIGATSDATVTINAALAVSPPTKTLSTNSSFSFSASGGVSPYSYSVFSGSGSINSSTGAYTAPASAGPETVRVTDSLGNTDDATVTVVSPLAISPATRTLVVYSTLTFTATGGQTPYIYSVFSGNGSINSSTGAYTAPATTGSVTIRVTDALGSTSDSAVTISAVLAISPSTKTLMTNSDFSFSATGGVPPFNYSIVSGSGSISLLSGAYTAPASTGTDVVRVTDSDGHTSDATITIIPTLTVSPSTTSVAVTGTTTFSASGGSSPYTFSVSAGVGSINSSSGLFSAGTVSGSSTVRVTDSLGNTADAAVTVDPAALSLADSTLTVASATNASGSADTITFTAKDSYGNQLTSGGLTVVFSNSGGTSTGNIGSTSDNSNGTYTASFTGVLAGTATTINATVNSTPFSGTLPTITVVPGPASMSQSVLTASAASLRINKTIDLSLTVKDAAGNQHTSGGLTVVFSHSGGTSTGSISATTDNGNGTYSATFTGVTPGTATTIRATIDGSAVTSTLPTLTVIGMNLEVPIEMVDLGLSSAAAALTFERSQTSLNTTDYDGTVTYYFEIVATNTEAAAKSVTLIDNASNTKATINVTASSSTQRYRISFTPNSGADIYRVKLPATAGANRLSVYSARIIVQQTNASMTKIYIPLIASNFDTVSNSNSSVLDSTTSGTYTQGNTSFYNLWKKNAAKLATIASGTPWTFEAVLSTNNPPEACYAALFNSSTATQVTGSQIANTSSSQTLVSANFADNVAGFDDLSLFEAKIKSTNGDSCQIGKAGLWVRLTAVSKGEVYYRVDKRYSALAGNLVSENSRIYLDTALFDFNSVNVFYETTGSVTAGSSLNLQLDDHGTNDSGTASPVPVTGCSLNAADLGTTRNRVRSASCSGWTDQDRYINEVVFASGSVTTSSQFVVVGFEGN